MITTKVKYSLVFPKHLLTVLCICLALCYQSKAVKIMSTVDVENIKYKNLDYTETTKTANCHNYLGELLIPSELNSDPSQVLLDFFFEYCDMNAYNFHKSSVVFFCFYTGMNLIEQTQASLQEENDSPLSKSQVIYKFCQTFGEGYQQRQNFFTEIMDIKDYNVYGETCTKYYKYVYNKEAAFFDPIDMYHFGDAEVICDNLFKMFEELRKKKRNEISQAIKYSYLLSIKYYVYTGEFIDYGNCQEYDAEEPTFCLNYYLWSTQFSLWSKSESRLVCGKVVTSLVQTETSDTCAFLTARVYEAYYYYVSLLLDSMAQAKLNALTDSLSSAQYQAQETQLMTSTDYKAIADWLSNVEEIEENRLESAVADDLIKERKELEEQVKGLRLQKKQIKSYRRDLASEYEVYQLQQIIDRLKREIYRDRVRIDQITKILEPQLIPNISYPINQFLLAMEKERYDYCFAIFEDMMELYGEEIEWRPFIEKMVKKFQRQKMQIGKDMIEDLPKDESDLERVVWFVYQVTLYDYNNTIGDKKYRMNEKQVEVAIFVADMLRALSPESEINDVNFFIEILMDEYDIEYSMDDWEKWRDVKLVREFIEDLKKREVQRETNEMIVTLLKNNVMEFINIKIREQNLKMIMRFLDELIDDDNYERVLEFIRKLKFQSVMEFINSMIIEQNFKKVNEFIDSLITAKNRKKVETVLQDIEREDIIEILQQQNEPSISSFLDQFNPTDTESFVSTVLEEHPSHIINEPSDISSTESSSELPIHPNMEEEVGLEQFEQQLQITEQGREEEEIEYLNEVDFEEVEELINRLKSKDIQDFIQVIKVRDVVSFIDQLKLKDVLEFLKELNKQEDVIDKLTKVKKFNVSALIEELQANDVKKFLSYIKKKDVTTFIEDMKKQDVIEMIDYLKQEDVLQLIMHLKTTDILDILDKLRRSDLIVNNFLKQIKEQSQEVDMSPYYDQLKDKTLKFIEQLQVRDIFDLVINLNEEEIIDYIEDLKINNVFDFLTSIQRKDIINLIDYYKKKDVVEFIESLQDEEMVGDFIDKLIERDEIMKRKDNVIDFINKLKEKEKVNDEQFMNLQQELDMQKVLNFVHEVRFNDLLRRLAWFEEKDVNNYLNKLSMEDKWRNQESEVERLIDQLKMKDVLTFIQRRIDSDFIIELMKEDVIDFINNRKKQDILDFFTELKSLEVIQMINNLERKDVIDFLNYLKQLSVEIFIQDQKEKDVLDLITDLKKGDVLDLLNQLEKDDIQKMINDLKKNDVLKFLDILRKAKVQDFIIELKKLDVKALIDEIIKNDVKNLIQEKSDSFNKRRINVFLDEESTATVSHQTSRKVAGL